MTAALDARRLALFEDLFRDPSCIRMHDELSADDFEGFVDYVFTCAGYAVEDVSDRHIPRGPGVDLNLYADHVGGKLVARVEVKRFEPGTVIYYDVARGFIGTLMIGHGVPGYLITTSDFHDNAYWAADEVNADKAATGDPNLVTLINGARFERYIAYVGGSRLAGEYAGTSIAPLEPIRPDVIIEGGQLATHYPLGSGRARILVLANNKGGVAKTTTALNLAFDLSREHTQGQGRKKVVVPGNRILLIDMDGQASLTSSLPAPGPEEEPVPEDRRHLAQYFRGQNVLAGLVRDTRYPNISIIPAHPDLHLLDTGGGARPTAELRFVNDLLDVARSANDDGERKFDWVILDTPPAQSFFTRLALAAADHVVIPAQAETYAMRGINRLCATLKTMNALTGGLQTWQQKILGCIVTRWRPGAGAESALAQLVLDLPQVGIRSFEDPIPFDDRIEQAIVNEVRGGLGNIFRLASQPGPAARAYVKLTEKVVERANKTHYKPSTANATKRANAVFEFDDPARLTIALAEVAADEAMRNRAFASQVRACYGQLPPSKTRTKADPTRALKVNLVPRKQYEGYRIDTSRALDPYSILDVYGPEQLPTALELFPLERLKEGSAKVEKRNPGTKPSNRGQKAAIVRYIVNTLT